jgi:uncharacterized protein (TIGR03437 family)
MSKLSRNVLAAIALIFPVSALAQPVINAVANNFSGITPGLPSYGIAPASLFVIYGAGLCANVPLAVQTSAPPAGLPQKLNGMTISVTVNNVTTTPAIYYAIPTQVAAVLPSTTPVGTGTITVTYNQQSTSAPLLVTKSAFGMLTANGIGSGLAKATNLEYQDITSTASAAPGQTIVLWGSGLGADTANNDRTYPMKQDNLNDATVYIGGVKATVVYAGRSQDPGLDQIDVTVPAFGSSPAFETSKNHDAPRASSGFQGGCANSVVVVSNGISSNFGLLPVAADGGICSDPEYGITGSGFGFTQKTITAGGLGIFQTSVPTAPLPAAQTDTVSAYAFGNFYETPGSGFSGTGAYSFGSCVVYSQSTQPSTTPTTIIGANAGTPIVLSGAGLSLKLPETATSGTGVGQYYALLPSLPVANDAYTFTAPGGANIGPFTATLTWPAPLDWTNKGSISAIMESDGQLITWSGGAPGTYVEIIGSSTAPAVAQAVAFICIVPVSDGQFTIPSYVLLAVPANTGELSVYNVAEPATFTAKGLDYGYLSYGSLSVANVTYQAEASSTPPGGSTFNGTYTGTFSGTETSNGKTIAGGVTAVIDNGVFTVTSPGNGTGTVNSTGQIVFGVDVTEGVSCSFSGQDVVTGTAAVASGTFTCESGAISGNWTVTRE